MIKKKDGTYRCCLDFTNINRVTLFDGEPMPQPEGIFAKFSKDTYFSKLEFCKGYHQIKMVAKDKEKTAFSTADGSFQYTKMPFWYD